MSKFSILLLCILMLTTRIFGQSYNPYVSGIAFAVPPSASGYLCGSTQNVQFNMGMTTATNATLWQTNPLTIIVCLTGFAYNGTTPSSIVTGTYASNFNWSFDIFSPNCLIGVQNQTLIGSPAAGSSGTVNLAIRVPENLPLNANLGVSVNLQLPGYMATGNVQGDDNASISTVSYCTCYSFITNPGVVAGSQLFFNLGDPVPFTSTSAGSGGTGTLLYQWQQSISGTWNDIVGATSDTYDAPLTTVNRSYRRNAKRSSCGTWMSSNALNVTIVVPDAGPDKTIDCANLSATIGTPAVSGVTYSWAPSTGLSSTTAAQPVATPLATTTYTVTMSNALGATATDAVIVTVDKTIPTVGATAPSFSVCAGSSITISGTGASTYSWMPGSLTGPSITVSPTATTTYTITGTGSNGCVGTNTFIVTVNPTPTVGSTATQTTICSGQSTTLSGTGANIYTWNFGSNYINPITVSPTSTTTYAVIGTNTSTGCTALSLRTIFVNASPNVTTSTSSTSVCPGGSVTLSASGAASYTWQPGGLTGTPVTVSPSANTTYTVTGTAANGCTKTATRTITMAVCTVNTVNIKLYIEGYYLGAGLMNPVLNNQFVAAPSTACDSITVELHPAANPGAIAATTKAVLNTNGNAVCTFSVSGSYYLAVKHRNALTTWSTAPVNVGGTPITYDFTTSSAQAFGGNQNAVGNSWGLFTGDLNGDENIDLIDLAMLEQSINSFDFGYFATDLNGDGNVDLLDTPLMENNVSSFIYSVHP